MWTRGLIAHFRIVHTTALGLGPWRDWVSASCNYIHTMWLYYHEQNRNRAGYRYLSPFRIPASDPVFVKKNVFVCSLIANHHKASIKYELWLAGHAAASTRTVCGVLKSSGVFHWQLSMLKCIGSDNEMKNWEYKLH